METGNRDQVGQPGGPQRLPIALRQRARIAQSQRPHVAGRTAGHRGIDPGRHRLPPGIHAPRVSQPFHRIPVADIADRRDPSRQRLLFRIEPARIAQPPRRPYPRREPPPAAGRDLPTTRRLIAPAVVPGEAQHPAAQEPGIVRRALHPEHEAGAISLVLGQLDHAPGQHQIRPLLLHRQLQRQRPRRVQSAPHEARQQRGRRTQPHPPAEQPACQAQQQSQPRGCHRRQRRQTQRQRGTRQQRCHQRQAEGRAPCRSRLRRHH